MLPGRRVIKCLNKFDKLRQRSTSSLNIPAILTVNVCSLFCNLSNFITVNNIRLILNQRFNLPLESSIPDYHWQWLLIIFLYLENDR